MESEKIVIDVGKMTPDEAENALKKMIESYKEKVFDIDHPFILKIYHLHKEYPNDIDFGGKIREIMVNIETESKKKLIQKNKKDLERIITENKKQNEKNKR